MIILQNVLRNAKLHNTEVHETESTASHKKNDIVTTYILVPHVFLLPRVLLRVVFITFSHCLRVVAQLPLRKPLNKLFPRPLVSDGAGATCHVYLDDRFTRLELDALPAACTPSK